MASTNIFLPINFNQVLELVDQLPASQKKQLAAHLLNDAEVEIFDIPETQKAWVRNSKEKYIAHPELLVGEDDAWKIIDAA